MKNAKYRKVWEMKKYENGTCNIYMSAISEERQKKVEYATCGKLQEVKTERRK
jgi:hypothetical protein